MYEKKLGKVWLEKHVNSGKWHVYKIGKKTGEKKLAHTCTDFAKLALSNRDSNINVSSCSHLRFTAAGLTVRDGLPPLIVERSN